MINRLVGGSQEGFWIGSLNIQGTSHLRDQAHLDRPLLEHPPTDLPLQGDPHTDHRAFQDHLLGQLGHLALIQVQEN